MTSFSLAVLGTEIKLFLIGVAIAGPVSIGLLLLIIKRIEKKNPERIRWR
ncbi:hypothetical protein [Prochlorococcus sp. MIT 1307]|nr:hypothetical protein [Prochlorococcus sp. MIT 1307]